MKKQTSLITVLWTALICIIFTGCAGGQDAGTAEKDISANEVLYQVSTLSALMQGVYDGEISLDQLISEGDLGLGTFAGLDGEMILLDGEVYQVLGDGKVAKPAVTATTPFAAVTFFESDREVPVKGVENLTRLQSDLDKLRESPNMFYVFKVTGTFDYVKTRSVPKQEKPYPPLVEVTEKQAEFEFQDVEGTIVGLWCPEYAEGVNMPGYHMHFLSEDRTKGGHLLECSLKEGTAYVDVTNGFNMLLPKNEHFMKADLAGTQEQDINKAEK